jgi:hypothetical protein
LALFLSLSLWRDISLVWLSLLCLIGLALPLALAYLAVRGMDLALNKAAIGLQKAQELSRQMRIQTEMLSERAATPVIYVHRRAARWQQIARALGIGRDASHSAPKSGQNPGNNRHGPVGSKR